MNPRSLLTRNRYGLPDRRIEYRCQAAQPQPLRAIERGAAEPLRPEQLRISKHEDLGVWSPRSDSFVEVGQRLCKAFNRVRHVGVVPLAVKGSCAVFEDGCKP